VKGGNFDKTMQAVAKREEKLLTRLVGAERELSVQFRDAHAEINGIVSTENFIYGFRLGARIGIEIVMENDGELIDIHVGG